MDSRKIQFVGNSTYVVSLPKKWVLKSNLREKNELFLSELHTGELILSPKQSELSSFNEIELNFDELGENLYHTIFSAFYLGFEKIKIFSSKEMTSEKRAQIKESLRHLSGSEIVSESPKDIVVKVFHDKTKIEFSQLLSRIGLILNDLIYNCLERRNLNDVKRDEDELDRLYHLSAKIVTLSQTDFNILNSSGIKNNTLIPALFMITKKLENLGDSLEQLAVLEIEDKVKGKELEPVLLFFKKEINKSISFLTKSNQKNFQAIPKEEEKELEKIIQKHPIKIREKLFRMLRHLVDIEEEIINISFYNTLIKDKLYK